MIPLSDLCNAAFELFGCFAMWGNVATLWRDKAVKGFSTKATVFFTSWGYWNLFYYWHLSQYFSWSCGAMLTLASTTYVILVLKYLNAEV